MALICPEWRKISNKQVKYWPFYGIHLELDEYRSWPLTNIPIRNAIQSSEQCPSIFPPELSILNVKHLKYLKFYGDLKHGCEIFNQEMPNLEQLIFGHLSCRGSVRLCLDQLRVLFLKDILGDTLTIDCPSLTALRCNRISKIEIKHPETLTYIGSGCFDDKILNFKNLESIHVNDIVSEENILQQLPHLNLISIYSDSCNHDSSYTLDNVHALMIEKQNLKRDVKIIYKREEIENIGQLDAAFKDIESSDAYDYDHTPHPSDFEDYDSI